MDRKKIMILGAGFGGLRAAMVLGKKIKTAGLQEKYEIILIDRNDHQTYTPLLYEVATISKETAPCNELHEVAAHNVKLLINSLPVGFLLREIKNADAAQCKITLSDNSELNCDYMIVSLGLETNFFGIKGLKENSLPLKTFADAVKIRDRIWNLAMDGKETIQIIIGGGGPTGVELAGELKEWCCELMQDFPKCRLDVKIIEAGQSILPGFDGKMINLAEKRLKKLNVGMIVGKRITEASPKEITLDNGEKNRFDILIWAGGVKASDILSKSGIKTDERGRIIVGNGNLRLTTPENSKVSKISYAIGDNISLIDAKTGKSTPGVARAAIIQAGIAASNMFEEIKKAENNSYQPKLKEYRPYKYPYVVPVGGKYAIAKIGRFVFFGFLGWILKGLIEMNYLLSIMPPKKAFKIWLKGLKIFAQNDRLG